jgi:hypothetical protein
LQTNCQLELGGCLEEITTAFVEPALEWLGTSYGGNRKPKIS